MRVCTILAGVIFSALLGGCVSSVDDTPTTIERPVGPGAALVDPVTAVTLFKNVCVATRPSFEQGLKNLSKSSFSRRDQTSDIRYDTRFDLSFKIGRFENQQGRGCSMVFASNEKPRTLAFLFASAVASATPGTPEIGVTDDEDAVIVELSKGQVFEFFPSGTNGSRKYYRAFIYPGQFK